MKFKTVSMLCLTLLLLGAFLFSEVKNPDKPLKGDWDLKLKEVMRIEDAGGDVLAKPRHLMVADDGSIYLYDNKTLKFYLFSKEGKFVKTFAPKGEGPGELKRFIDAFLVGDKLVVVDAYEIEYLSKDGTFIRKVQNDFSQRLPSHFFNEDEIISFPILRYNDPQEQGKILRSNLKTNQESVLVEFELYEGGVVRKAEIVMGVLVPGLTPQLIVRFEADRFYYGRNDSYQIIVADYNGKEINRFSVARKKGKAPEEEKQGFFKERPIPPEMIPTLLESVPNDYTYFSLIRIYNNLIYVYDSNLDRKLKSQQVDIFSLEGKYLYQAVLRPPEGFNIVSAIAPLVAIKGGYLYMVLVGDDGKVAIVKYEATLPSA